MGISCKKHVGTTARLLKSAEKSYIKAKYEARKSLIAAEKKENKKKSK